MPYVKDTIAARATAPGRGGVGIVRVSGPGVRAISREILGEIPEPRLATYSDFSDGKNVIDQGIALYFNAPGSFTGEDVLELQAHGGPVILQLLLARCLEAALDTDLSTGRPYLGGLRIAPPSTAASAEGAPYRGAIIGGGVQAATHRAVLAALHPAATVAFYSRRAAAELPLRAGDHRQSVPKGF